MMTLKRIGIASALSLGLFACGGGGADEIKKLVDEMCACKTKECADAVDKKLDKAGEKITSEAEMKEALGHVVRAAECQSKLEK